MEKPLVMDVSGMEPNLMGLQKGFRLISSFDTVWMTILYQQP